MQIRPQQRDPARPTPWEVASQGPVTPTPTSPCCSPPPSPETGVPGAAPKGDQATYESGRPSLTMCR